MEHSLQLVCQRNGGHWSWAGQSRGCDTSSGWVRAPRGVGVRSHLHLQPTVSSEGARIHPPAVYQLPGGGKQLSLHMSSLNSTPSSPDLVLVRVLSPCGSRPSYIQSCKPGSGSHSCQVLLISSVKGVWSPSASLHPHGLWPGQSCLGPDAGS